MTSSPSTQATPPLGGADIELGNSISGRNTLERTCAPAAQAVLQAIKGMRTASLPPDVAHGYEPTLYGNYSDDTPPPVNFQDRWRTYLPSNGSSIYIDLDHVEVCLPEIRSATDFVQYWHGMLRIVAEARQAASDRLPEAETLHLLVNNSDGLSNSYGAHLNFLVSRHLMEDLAAQRLGPLFFLASYQVSSIIFTGAGKVGSEDQRPHVGYQLSQRADFLRTVCALQTTYQRPIVNLRDEAHCGPWDRRADGNGLSPAEKYARCHVIMYDANLCHVANYLKFGVMQIILAMLDAGQVDPRLIVEDPVAAAVTWSHDISLTATVRLLSGEELTALQLQVKFLELAEQFVASGACIVPDAPQIIRRWSDILVALETASKSGSFEPLAPMLDWALKLVCIQQALDDDTSLHPGSPEIKCIDQAYGSLDPTDGLYLACEASGAVERLVDDAEIERAVHEPPTNTRAWTRAMLLRRTSPARIDMIDWDSIQVHTHTEDGRPARRTLEMPDPNKHTLADCKSVFDDTSTLDEALDALGATWDAARTPTIVTTGSWTSTGSVRADSRDPYSSDFDGRSVDYPDLN